MKIARYELNVVYKKELILTMEDDVDSEDVEYKVYSVTTIKNGYGFRVLLTFADESTKTQQHAGFTTKREANAFRDEVIGQLHTGPILCMEKFG